MIKVINWSLICTNIVLIPILIHANLYSCATYNVVTILFNLLILYLNREGA